MFDIVKTTKSSNRLFVFVKDIVLTYYRLLHNFYAHVLFISNRVMFNIVVYMWVHLVA